MCKNGIGPGAISDTERTEDQCPPTPPPFTDNHLNSAEWSIRPSKLSGTYARKQEIGNALTFSFGNGALDKTGDANINQPLLAPSYIFCASFLSPYEYALAALANAIWGEVSSPRQ